MHSRFYSSLSVPLSLNHWHSFFNSRNWWDVMQNTCSYYFNTCWCNCPTELSVCVFVYCLSLSVAFASLLNCLIKLCYELKVKTVFTHVVVDSLLFIHSISILVFIFAFLLLCWNFVTVFSLHATDMIHFGIDITILLLVLWCSFFSCRSLLLFSQHHIIIVGLEPRGCVVYFRCTCL